jgi:hypothetical protein
VHRTRDFAETGRRLGIELQRQRPVVDDAEGGQQCDQDRGERQRQPGPERERLHAGVSVSM